MKNWEKEKQKQILKWYQLWLDWYRVFDNLSYEDGHVPKCPDEIYVEDKLLKEFADLSQFERDTIKNMASIQLGKYFKM